RTSGSHHASRLSTLRLPRPSTLFPYTTLFRSTHRLHADPQGRRGQQGLHRHSAGCGLLHGQSACPQRGHAEPLGAMGDRTCTQRSEEHTSELQSRENLVCRLLLEKKKKATHSV